MKAGFGLVGLLVVCGIVIWYWGSVQHPADVVRQSEHARDAAEKLASAGDLAQSATLTPALGGKALIVKMLLPEGAMAKRFPGLQVGDQITGIDEYGSFDTLGGADATLVYQYGSQGKGLTITRNGAKFTIKAQ